MLTAPRPTPMRARMRAGILLVSAICLAAPGAGVAQAATLTVTTTADTGPGSLRQTIANAAAGDTIEFAVTGTITTSNLNIDKNLTISGPGPELLAISGGGSNRSFIVREGLTVTIQGLTIRDGNVMGNGAGIFVYFSTLIVNNCVFIGNRAWHGGAITVYEGDLRVSESTFSQNTALYDVGAIQLLGGFLRVDRTTFDRNSAPSGGGLSVELFDTVPQAVVTNATFSANVGGAVYNWEGNLTFNNSTFVANVASLVYGGGPSGINSLVGNLTLKNSLFAAGTGGPHCLWDITNPSSQPSLSGVNLADDDSCGITPVPTAALNLGPLASNGGRTQTHALLEGSVALDSASECTDAAGQPVSRDQRGVRRPQGLACDVGAFEREANTFTFSGFFAPVDNLPTINLLKAGSAVPVKFSLGGDHGLGILAAGFPQAPAVPCTPGSPTDSITEVVTAGNSRLSYDQATLSYTYVWKTDKAWANTCRELHIRLTDGSLHKARFQFGK